MTRQIGMRIVDVLEEAGARYLSIDEPKVYRTLLLVVGGTDALRRYEPSEAYWRRVQAILDGFFSSAERVEICDRLIALPGLRTRPEFQSFWRRALAERQMQGLIAAAALASSAIVREPQAPFHRPR